MTSNLVIALLLFWLCKCTQTAAVTSITAYVGEPVKLVCPVTLQRYWNDVTWETEDGEFLSKGEAYQFNRVRPEDASVYVCRKRQLNFRESITHSFRLIVLPAEQMSTDANTENPSERPSQSTVARPLSATSESPNPSTSEGRIADAMDNQNPIPNQPSANDRMEQTSSQRPDASMPYDVTARGQQFDSTASQRESKMNTDCQANQIPCGISRVSSTPPGAKCILKHWLCDGENDCYNNWDEEDCKMASEKTLCWPQRYKCKNSDQLIPMGYRCDNERDCTSGDDEEDCSLPEVILNQSYQDNSSYNQRQIRITCSARGQPPPVIVWRQNNGRVTADHRIEESCKDDGRGFQVHSTLIIFPKQHPDSYYMYICEATSSFGRSFSSNFTSLRV